MRMTADAASVSSKPRRSPRRPIAAARELRLELHLAAQEEAGVEPAEHDVGVGDRRLRAAAAVGRRPRIRARALRADLQEAAGIDPADRAAARADGARRNALHAHGQPELDLEVGRVERLAVDDQADVAARSAHVQRDCLPAVRGTRHVRAADRAAGDAREQQVRGALARLVRERVAAVRLQQRPAPGHALLVERRRDAVDVALEERLRVRVDRGRRPALVLAPDRCDLVRERHRQVGKALAQQLAGRSLVIRIEVGEEQAHRDRDGPSAVGGEPLGDAIAEPLQVDRLEHAALLVDALRDGQAVGAVHQRLGLAPVEVVVVLAVDPLDVGHVLEARGRQIEHARAAAGQHGVDADRGADDDERHVRRVEPGRAERRGDRSDRIGGVRRHLGDVPAPAGVVDRDEVGERAPGVDSDSDSHAATLPVRADRRSPSRLARMRVAVDAPTGLAGGNAGRPSGR